MASFPRSPSPDDDDDRLACRNVMLPALADTRSQAKDIGGATLGDLAAAIRVNLVGDDEVIATPFGPRRLVYCDWTASARALHSVEDYMRYQVLPLYANTHSSSSKTAAQTSCFRHEARQIVQLGCNANPAKDVVIFTPQGATAAINKLVGLLGPALQQAVVFVGPFEHHSNLLPWRESGAKVVAVPALPSGSGLDHSALSNLLRDHASSHRLRIGAFSAASNVTGVMENVDLVSSIMHRNSGLVFWDYSAAAPYVKIDANPVILGDDAAFVEKDAVFFSSHKFVGGVGGSGVLICKKKLFSVNSAPTVVGGGTVLFVDADGHRFLKSKVEREEAGSPNSLADIRAGLAMQIKQTFGPNQIALLDDAMLKLARAAWTGVNNLVLLGPSLDQPRLPIFSFLVSFAGGYLHHNFVSSLLNDMFGIQCRGGCMCAGPYVQELLGMDKALVARYEAEMLLDDREHLRPGITRLSLAYFESPERARYVLEAVKLIAEHGWRMLPMYRFNSTTGEWGHIHQFGKFPTRRWLHDAALFSRPGSQLVGEANVFPAVMDLDAVLKEAHRLFMTPPATTSHVIEPDQNPLRWFALPSEALAQLLGLIVPKPPMELIPKLYCVEIASSAAVGEVPVPPLSAPHSPLVLRASKAAEKESRPSNRATKHPRRSDMHRPESFASSAAAAARDQAPELPPAVLAAEAMTQAMSSARVLPAVPRELSKQCVRASKDWNMMRPGDRILLGLSGGKDSLCLLHILLDIQKRAPFPFTLAACTIDPGTDAFDPSPLIPYVKALGVEYFYERTTIFQDAKRTLPPGSQSYCSFCARMKRGTLYRVAKQHGYNVLALAQHLDDFAESFIMSAFRNGQLRTMKACYDEENGAVRVIRPLVYVREKETKHFSYTAKLPVIPENCPACFQPASERARVKQLIKHEEEANPNLFGSLRKTLLPLMGSSVADELLKIGSNLRSPGLAVVECVESCEV